ncbi:CAP domain-containing protein [uncultured Paracoccus sp.]|uniref:CAP domain-containing protein n=1 Tax=uncultured Paracoccus sp. TaxID=189685 RepID=UPI0025F45BEF|nr:CAP domain-containing protein [uncultured Paracoccus sp.]
MPKIGSIFAFAAACMALSAGFHAPAVQAQSLGGAATNINRPSVTGAVRCFQTTRAENAQGAAHTSQIRARQGLAGVAPNPRLAEAAAMQACDMARQNQMTHAGLKHARPSQRLRAVGYRQSIVAENIGMGFKSAEQVQAAWIASSSHLSNIMLPQVQEFGIGKAIGADGRTVFWAAVYAARR